MAQNEDAATIFGAMMAAAAGARGMIDQTFEISFGEALERLRTVDVEERDLTSMRRVMRWTFDEGMISAARSQLGSEAVKLLALGRPDVLEEMADHLKLIAQAASDAAASSESQE